MHTNYYFLRQLSKALEQKLNGYSAVSCFSQNKEELLLELNNGEQSFFIKAHLLSSFVCLSFPTQLSRARKNSVDLFDEIILKKVTHLTQFENERSFSIHFENGYSLLFKMHAHRSNVLLVKEDEVVRVFRNQFKADLLITPSSLHRKIDWSEACFLQHKDELKQTYFTFGKEIWRSLHEKGFDSLDPGGQWQLLNTTLRLLEEPTYYIHHETHQFSLLPSAHGDTVFHKPIEAVTEFFYQFTHITGLEKEKAFIRKNISTSITNCLGYIAKNEKKLKEITYQALYKTWADVLMANLHQIEKGAKQVDLMDFTNRPITIKLKPALSPQKNAEIFYRKAKNQEIEIKKLTESIQQKKKELEGYRAQLEKLETLQSVKAIKTLFKKSNEKTDTPKSKEVLPFHVVEYNGFQIWIGKNAVNNDLLTLKYSHKNDLWFHAKDVSGSHVVIKYKAGQPFPKDVIVRAAELAAYNSKRKTDSLCPVAYTPKKFVRKRKGDPAGAVVVEREEVLMVTPKL